MHMSDALVSPPVALGAVAVSSTLIVIAARKLKNNQRPDIIPLMGIMGAFVFAAQMINFTIPGTGSSGHLIGGILLAALLGPWSAFLTLSSILIVQCLVFADGGLLALGCNILNMAATSCLIGYPLFYKPIAGSSLKPWRILVASVVGAVGALEIGAFFVTLETEFSGITALPFSTFLKFMLPIHVVIGLVEGLATGALLIFVASYRPSLLGSELGKEVEERKSVKTVLWTFALLALFMAGGFSVLASEYPDGLEWSIEKVSGISELPSDLPPTAFMPDYDSNFAGIVGSILVMVILWAFSSLLLPKLKKPLKGK